MWWRNVPLIIAGLMLVAWSILTLVYGWGWWGGWYGR